MNALVEAFVKWAMQDRRWPLLLPLAIPVVFFPFIKLYLELSFRETVDEWRFWVTSGVLIILSGLSFW